MSMDLDARLDKGTMTSQERKEEYRILLDEIETLRKYEIETLQETAEDVSAKTDKLQTVVETADKLFNDANLYEHSQNPDELMLDAKVIVNGTDVLRSATQSINLGTDNYNPKELARKMRAKFNIEEDPDTGYDLSGLASISAKMLKFPPDFSYMYGSVGQEVEEEEKPVKERKQQSEKVAEAPEKKEPEVITETDKEEDSVDDTVKFFYWALKKEFEENGNEPVNYFQFVIDPNDFSTTIGNMFHVSFLVRDGKIKIHDEENGLLKLTPMSGQPAKEDQKRSDYKQCVISIDMKDWKDLIESYNIETNLLDKWKPEWDTRKAKED